MLEGFSILGAGKEKDRLPNFCSLGLRCQADRQDRTREELSTLPFFLHISALLLVAMHLF